MYIIKTILITILITFVFDGCTVNSFNLRQVVATNNAIEMEKNYYEISKLLIQYKKYLDNKNPKSFNKIWSKATINNISNHTNNISFKNFGNNYNKYLKYALSTNPNITNRDDYLILGLYKLLFSCYGVNNKKYTALSYKLKNLQEFSYALQVIKWQVHHKRDTNHKYLFYTWQKQWQIELAQKSNYKSPNYNIIKNLTTLKNKQESLFDSSDMRFESLLTQMLYINNNSIKRMGGEPKSLTLEAVKWFIFL